jgi:xanthine dehydrogenase accessory factor
VPGLRVGARVAVHATGVVESDVTDGATRAWMTDEARLALRSGVTSARAAASVDVLVEVVTPPPRLFVLGAGHDAVPVVQIARAVGWDAVVCEPHARWATRERFGTGAELLALDDAALAARIDAACRPLAIVMGHSYEQDRARLAMLLRTRAEYIGVLGPRRRTDRILGEIGAGSIDDPRIHAPVGLALGAETPQEIALAIVAEVQSVLTRATASSLRERRGPIHAEEEAAE